MLRDMVDSPALKAQAPPPDLGKDRAFDPLPPEETIARGYLPDRFAATPDDSLRAGEELASPLPAILDSRLLARGKQVFEVFCAPCHGPAGLGDGPVTRRGVPAPPSLLADRARAMKDGQMFHVITRGQNTMPPYASQVERDDRWKVIGYIRSLQAKPAR